MQDICRREINYLRVSVTDRCNLRCIYCMPPGGVEAVYHDQILRNEEIIRLVRAGVAIGIKKVRVTGGEPLVRRGLVDLIKSINEIGEIDDIALTTNGILFPSAGRELKEAGLRRVNISLDTLDPDMFSFISGNGRLEQVWKGIETALSLGFHPVKLNAVIMRGFNDREIIKLAALSLNRPLHVRFIELMPVGPSDAWTVDRHMPAGEIRTIIESGLDSLEAVHKPSGNGPAKYFSLPGAKGTVGFISAVSDHFCRSCNRLRLTAEGMIRPCLYSGREIDARGPLRLGAGDDELEDLFRQAISIKPERHSMNSGWQDEKRSMSQIGG